MGIFQTFREAVKYRLQEQRGESLLNKTVHYMGVRRKVIKETSKDVYLKGIRGPVSKEVFVQSKHNLKK